MHPSCASGFAVSGGLPVEGGRDGSRGMSKSRHAAPPHRVSCSEHPAPYFASNPAVDAAGFGRSQAYCEGCAVTSMGPDFVSNSTISGSLDVS